MKNILRHVHYVENIKYFCFISYIYLKFNICIYYIMDSENKTIENKDVENKTVEDKTVENKTVENKDTENKKFNLRNFLNDLFYIFWKCSSKSTSKSTEVIDIADNLIDIVDNLNNISDNLTNIETKIIDNSDLKENPVNETPKLNDPIPDN